MNCRDALERLGDLVGGDLPVRERLRLAVHLRTCEHCRNYLQSYRITLRAEQAALDGRQPDIPDSLAERIVQASNRRSTRF